eukprot:4335826-Prymnesium_polylepis.1
MVVGMVLANPDRFSIVLLAPLRASETITVTDAGEIPLLAFGYAERANFPHAALLTGFGCACTQ